MGKTKIQEKRQGKALTRVVFLWQVWHSLPCLSDSCLPCQFPQTKICQLHTHNHPAVNGDMLTAPISLINISSSHPARTSILTPTLTTDKGSLCFRASQYWVFQESKGSDEVCITLVPGWLRHSHSSCWTTTTFGQAETHESASKHSAYAVLISCWFTSALVICPAERCRQQGGRTH